MSEERTPAVRGAAARQTTPAQITEAVIASFEPRSAEDPERPEGISGPWFSAHNDIVLAPGDEPEATVDSGGTA